MTNNSIEVFIINYNGKNTVLSTIESLYNSEDVKVSISIIDDHSTDESPDLIKKRYPEIPTHILPVNTKRANILRNKALRMASADYVLITDNDLKYDRSCIAEMLKLMEKDSKIVTCTPRLMYWNQTDKIYIAGTRVHFIGAAISDQRDKIYKENNHEPSINSGSGICLVQREVALKVGGFDEKLLHGWGDDGEFYQRLLRTGYKCFYVPSAFALHEDKLKVTERKFRVVGATYNRWVFILSHYSIPLIILLIPVFIIYEFFQAAFVWVKGVFPQYLQGNLLILKNFRTLIEKRKFVQKLKTVSDKEVLFAGNLYVAPALIQKNEFIKIAISGLSWFLNFYWRLIKNIIP
jgi:GT2 family glycosyltransferase